MVHVHIPEPLKGLYAVKVPLFFVASGLLFEKSFNSSTHFLAKRCDQLLVPFLLYYLISYVLFYLLQWYVPSFLSTNVHYNGWQDVFVQRHLFNGPIWFLLCLFEVEMVFYGLFRFIHNEPFRLISILFLALVGLYLSVQKLFLPAWIDATLVALPFFYIGYLLYHYGKDFVYNEHKSSLYVVFILFSYLIYRIFPCNIHFSLNVYDHPQWLYLSGTTICLSLFACCKWMRHCSPIEWIGRNSITLLCTHHIVYRPIKFALIHLTTFAPDSYSFCITLFIFTLLAELPIVFLINRFFPILCGKGNVLQKFVYSKSEL